jgi:hypothetical protein
MSPVQLLGGDPLSIGDPAVFGVITVSDRASSGVYEDLSGPAILQFFHEAIESPWTAKYAVIPDEQPIIEQTIKDMVRAVTMQQQQHQQQQHTNHCNGTAAAGQASTSNTDTMVHAA